MTKLTKQQMEDHVRNLDEKDIPDGATHYVFNDGKEILNPFYKCDHQSQKMFWFASERRWALSFGPNLDFIPLSIRDESPAPKVTLEDLVKHPNFKGNKAVTLLGIFDKLTGDYSHLAEGIKRGEALQAWHVNQWVGCANESHLVDRPESYRIKPKIDHSKEFVTGRRVWVRNTPVVAWKKDESHFQYFMVNGEGVVNNESLISYEQPDGAKTHKEAGFYCE